MSHGGGIATRKVFARTDSFCALLPNPQLKYMPEMHRFLDGLETFQMVWKLSGQPGNFPDDLETFRMVWKLSAWSGNFPDGGRSSQSSCVGGFLEMSTERGNYMYCDCERTSGGGEVVMGDATVWTAPS